MADYNINDFVSSLRDYMYRMFPYEPDMVNDLKHVIGNTNPKPYHIRKVAFGDNPTERINDDILIFDIGNEYAEREYPYYHILQDSPVIKKKGRANQKGGSQEASVVDLGSRNYNKVSFNGKVFVKNQGDYIDSVRKYLQNESTRTITDSSGKAFRINRDAGSYKNIHYHYIENMLSTILPILSNDYNLKFVGVKDNGLAEEYLMDEFNLEPQDFETSTLITEILGMKGM